MKNDDRRIKIEAGPNLAGVLIVLAFMIGVAAMIFAAGHHP